MVVINTVPIPLDCMYVTVALDTGLLQMGTPAMVCLFTLIMIYSRSEK